MLKEDKKINSEEDLPDLIFEHDGDEFYVQREPLIEEEPEAYIFEPDEEDIYNYKMKNDEAFMNYFPSGEPNIKSFGIINMPETETIDEYNENRKYEAIARLKIFSAFQRQLVEPETFPLSDKLEVLTKEAKDLESLGEISNLHIAIRLKKIRDRKLYKTLGNYHSFKDYLAGNFPDTRGKAYQLIGVIEQFAIKDLVQLKKFEYSKFTHYTPLLRNEKINEGDKKKIRNEALEHIGQQQLSEKEIKRNVKDLKRMYLEEPIIEFNPDRLVLTENSIKIDDTPLLTFLEGASSDFRQNLVNYIQNNYIKLNNPIKYCDSAESIEAMELNQKNIYLLSYALKYRDLDSARKYLKHISSIVLLDEDFIKQIEEEAIYLSPEEGKRRKKNRGYRSHYTYEYIRSRKQYLQKRKIKDSNMWLKRNIQIIINAFLSRDIELIKDVLQKSVINATSARKIFEILLLKLNTENKDAYDYQEVFDYIINDEENNHAFSTALSELKINRMERGCALYWALYNKNKRMASLLIELGYPVNIGITSEYVYGEGVQEIYDPWKTPIVEALTTDLDIAKMIMNKYINNLLPLSENLIGILSSFLMAPEELIEIIINFFVKYLERIKEETKDYKKTDDSMSAKEHLEIMKGQYFSHIIIKVELEKALTEFLQTPQSKMLSEAENESIEAVLRV